MNTTASKSQPLLEQAAEYFRAHEGVISHMYLDVVGLVTVGVGCLLSTPEAAAELPFVDRASRRPASREAIAAEWRNVHDLPKAKVASWYRPHTTLELSAEAIDAEMRKRLGEFVLYLRRRWAKFDSFPRPVQLGLLDMSYSLGVGGLIRKYPRFCAAIDRADWQAAAVECTRRNVSPARNQALRDLFLSA